MMRIVRFFLAALLISGTLPGVAAEKPPIAELRPVTETLHGVKVTDDYRYFEGVESDPKVQKWLSDQASHARAELDRLPRRGKLLERIEKLSDGAEANVSSVSRLPCGWFYLKRASGEDQYKLYVRENGEKERVLFDPEIDRTAPLAINHYSSSPGGKYVAVGVSPKGSELVVIRVIDVETGKDTGVGIDRARYWGVTWLDDESGFFYVRSPLISKDAPETERYQNMSLQFHRMGADPEKDFVVLGPSVPGGTDISPTQAPYPHLRHGDSRVFVALVDGVKRDFELWVADQAGALEGKPEWRKLFGEEDQVQYFDVRDGNLYVITVKDAPRGKLLRVDIEHPDFSKGETLIPAGEQVVEAVSAAKDALYVTLHDGGVSRLRRLPLSGGECRRGADSAGAGAAFGRHQFPDGWCPRHAEFLDSGRADLPPRERGVCRHGTAACRSGRRRGQTRRRGGACSRC